MSGLTGNIAEREGGCLCGAVRFRAVARSLNANMMLAAPTFNNDDDFVLSTEIFIDEKPDFYEFSNHTKKFTEADVLAHFSEKRS